MTYEAANLLLIELRRLEWDGGWRCPRCHERSIDGHKPRCTLAAALRAATATAEIPVPVGPEPDDERDVLPIAGSSAVA